MTHACSICPKHFKSRAAAEQHCRDKHRVACLVCGKRFKSQRAADQHFRDAHPEDDSDSDSDSDSTSTCDDAPYPPFPGAYGAWVLADAFVGRKGFGVFECSRCCKTWMSAHAQVRYRQGCRGCNTMLHPLLMWESWECRESTERGDTAKPHDRSRCEGCMAGSCLI